MHYLLAFCVISSLIIIHTNFTYAYHPDFTWKDAETMMSPDLRNRMRRGEVQKRRKYCGDCSKDTDGYRICGNNGIMYPNECIFECSKLTYPGLKEATDYGVCGTITFTEFKQEPFKGHY